jgi:NADH-quinone oxidoreductase subunit L
MGGAGKSAMFPLHIWLPDAMEGPTPVSALIHAATMVVAGVFLVARLFPVFAISCPAALDVVMVVGIISAALAAVIACTQTDIKRVLAYSTMSQIGFMMFSLGVARWGSDAQLGFTASMFHLFTHAFFKALLFLGAGVVIHRVHSNELKAMGGLKKHLPVTHFTFLIACLAIAGIPPLSGFFSKEEILLATYHHHTLVFVMALFTSGLTAFYMFRLYFSIFWNAPSAHHSDDAHHGEGGFAMTFPLILLCAGAALAGFIPFSRFVSADGVPFATHLHLDFSILPVAMGLTGIGLAMMLYKNKNQLPDRIAAQLKSIYTLSLNKFYVDEVYTAINKSIMKRIAGPAAWTDRKVVDGAVNLTGEATETLSEGIREMQSGQVQQYALWFVAGVIILGVVVMYGMK